MSGAATAADEKNFGTMSFLRCCADHFAAIEALAPVRRQSVEARLNAIDPIMREGETAFTSDALTDAMDEIAAEVQEAREARARHDETVELLRDIRRLLARGAATGR